MASPGQREILDKASATKSDPEMADQSIAKELATGEAEKIKEGKKSAEKDNVTEKAELEEEYMEKDTAVDSVSHSTDKEEKNAVKNIETEVVSTSISTDKDQKDDIHEEMETEERKEGGKDIQPVSDSVSQSTDKEEKKDVKDTETEVVSTSISTDKDQKDDIHEEMEMGERKEGGKDMQTMSVSGSQSTDKEEKKEDDKDTETGAVSTSISTDKDQKEDIHEEMETEERKEDGKDMQTVSDLVCQSNDKEEKIEDPDGMKTKEKKEDLTEISTGVDLPSKSDDNKEEYKGLGAGEPEHGVMPDGKEGVKTDGDRSSSNDGTCNVETEKNTIEVTETIQNTNENDSNEISINVQESSLVVESNQTNKTENTVELKVSVNQETISQESEQSETENEKITELDVSEKGNDNDSSEIKEVESFTETSVTDNDENIKQIADTTSKALTSENIKEVTELSSKENKLDLSKNISELGVSSTTSDTSPKPDSNSVISDEHKVTSGTSASNDFRNSSEQNADDSPTTKDTAIVNETLSDSRLQINAGCGINNDIHNLSSRATYGDSSCDNMSMSAVSESKSLGFERRSFPVERLAADDNDMNQLKEERLEQYLKSMRSVNETDTHVHGQEPQVEGVNSGEKEEGEEIKMHQSLGASKNEETNDHDKPDKSETGLKSDINESLPSTDAEVKDTSPGPSKHVSENILPEPSKMLLESTSVHKLSKNPSPVNSDRNFESSNGEKSQSDLEVASIMKKSLREEGISEEVMKDLPLEDSCMTEQNDDTKIPDIEIGPQDEELGPEVKIDIGEKLKEISPIVDKEKQASEDLRGPTFKGTSSDEVAKTENKSTEKDSNTETKGDQDTQVLPEKDMNSAFIKMPVSSKAKKDSEQPREILKRKMFDEFTEDSSNSSWYIIKDKPTEEPMDTEDKNRRLLVTDEGSNLSIPDDSSLASASAMEDSRMSFTDQVSNMDETSNLSVEDSCSVKAFGHEPVLDESANLNPPDKDLFVQPSTPSSVVTDATSEPTPVKRYRKGTLAQAVEEASEHGHNVQAKDLFEYQWPQESGADWFMLQEQISTYLEVKSFKRKYPDLVRRVCDKTEKDFLREKGVVSETQSDLGLTALRSEDVHELICKDYPSKYREYCTVLHEKEKERMANKQKDYVLPKLEKGKMREYTMKAMKSTSEWNRQFLKERNEERRAYFDMQTFAIQYPRSKFRKIENIKGVQTAYPVSLIPGQFQEYCKRYTAEELKYLPLNTAMLNPPKKMPQKPDEEKVPETLEEEVQKAASGSESGDESSSDSGDSDEEKKEKPNGEKQKEKSVSREPSAEKNHQEATPVKEEVPAATCRVCCDEDKPEKQRSERQRRKRKTSKTDEELIQCSECKKSGHPSCLDLTDAMLKVIKTYPWQCMECKTCVQCMDPYDEDKMLFCDQCDRGYHTFCVGLKSLPTGKWECVSCRGDSTPVKPIPKPPAKSTVKGKRGRPPKDPNAR